MIRLLLALAIAFAYLAWRNRPRYVTANPTPRLPTAQMLRDLDIREAMNWPEFVGTSG